MCQYKYNISNGQKIASNIQYETGTAMNAGESDNYLAISSSSSASKSVEISTSIYIYIVRRSIKTLMTTRRPRCFGTIVTMVPKHRGRHFLGPNIVSFNRMEFTYPIPDRWRMCTISHSIPRRRTAISWGVSAEARI